MSVLQEIEKLRAMRVELEAESRSLKELQNSLENNVMCLEEKVATEELKKERVAIEELKRRNEATKDAIAGLKSKKKKLENKLEETLQKPEELALKEKHTEEALAQPKEMKDNESNTVSEEYESEDDSVVVTAIEEVVEEQEVIEKNAKKQEKKKRRFF